MHLSTSSLLLALLPLGTAGPIALNHRDYKTGCTDSSFGDFSWTVEDFDYHASYIFTTPAHQNSWGYASFNLSNPAISYRASCSATSNQLSDFFYGNLWYNCTVPEGSEDGGDAKFEYNRASGQLDVNQTWYCDDQDPQYPITFRAAGTVNLTLDCKDTTYQNPNWTMGEIYSDRTVTCAPVDVTVEPYEITAVA